MNDPFGRLLTNGGVAGFESLKAMLANYLILTFNLHTITEIFVNKPLVSNCKLHHNARSTKRTQTKRIFQRNQTNDFLQPRSVHSIQNPITVLK